MRIGQATRDKSLQDQLQDQESAAQQSVLLIEDKLQRADGQIQSLKAQLEVQIRLLKVRTVFPFQ